MLDYKEGGISVKRTFLLIISLLSLTIAGCSTNASESGVKTKEVEKETVGMGWKHENPAAPTAGEWEPISFPDGTTYRLDPPPENDSEETKKDLEELKDLATNRTEEDIKIINKWAGEIYGPNTRWFTIAEEMLGKYNLAPPEAARVHYILSGTIYTSSVAAFHEKYRYLRPRPTHLDPTLQLIDNFSVPAHPSYPSAHSTTGWAAYTILTFMFPEDEDTFLALVRESDHSRKLAGVHFESDNKAGKQLGTNVAIDVIKSLENDPSIHPYDSKSIQMGSGH